jgi:carbamate kinase
MPRETMVIALGGNSLLPADRKFSIHQEEERVRESCKGIARIVRAGYRVVLTHGNGPQVGDILIQQEVAAGKVPPMPLDVCGAQTQGEIGYLLQRTLRTLLPGKRVVTIITQVRVDPHDKAFSRPTKFIGPPYSEMPRESGGKVYRQDSGRGYRRVVPSPEPIEIMEREEIRKLSGLGYIVIACGGGGVPVAWRSGRLQGIEAVIDKDLAAERLATDVRASTLLIFTGVGRVALNYGKPGQKDLAGMSVEEAEIYLGEGHFPPGNMGPKIVAASRFLRHGGRRVIITSSDKAWSALEGRAGTRITRRGKA